MVSVEEARRQIEALEAKIKGLQLSYSELRAIETTASRILRILGRMTGSEEVSQAIAKLQRFIATVRLAQATWRMFERATGPIGWAFWLTGVAMTAISAGDMMMEVGS